MGSFFYSMDNKGRVNIPPRFRDVLQERQDRQLILTNYDGYIIAFAYSEWLKITAALDRQAPLFDKEMRRFQRFLYGRAEECPLDRMGRILIPQHLRTYARLTREVAILGVGRAIEIWDRQTFDQAPEDMEESMSREVQEKYQSMMI